MPPQNVLRRRLLLASIALPVWPTLQGCAKPLPELSHPGTAAAAHALLLDSAAAHGAAAFAAMGDISVRYTGQWRAIVGKLQPDLVDLKFRGGSEERLLLRERMVGQAFTGPGGHKQVTRHTASGGQGDVHVWFNGEEALDRNRRAAAALVVDGYSLFLLGPMVLARYWAAERELVMDLDGNERLVQEGRHYDCEVLRLRMQPGLGFSSGEQLALFIDKNDGLMRRARFTLNGLDSTQGAIAEVEMFDHVARHGVQWPTRFYERLLRPLPLPVHDWRLVGLDVNRGLSVSEVSGPAFAGRAIAPAAALT